MSIAQLQITWPEGNREQRPVPTGRDCQRVVEHMRNRGWITARQLRAELGYDERTLREIASRSLGMILGGQKGYRLTCEATREEIEAGAGWLESQGRKMLQRAADIRARATADPAATV